MKAKHRVLAAGMAAAMTLSLAACGGSASTAEPTAMPTEEQMAGMGDWDLFESGRLGMIVTGIWAFPEYTSNCDFDWDIVVEPGHTQKATHFFSNGYVVSKDSQVADEAVKFITYISSNREATQIRLDAG